MKRTIILAALMLALAFSFSSVAKADTTSAGGVTYTFTNAGSDGSGGYLVDLTIDTTGATASGTLNLFSIQLFDGSTSITNATITSGPTGWAVSGFGNTNHCGSGHLPFICSQGPGITVTSGGPGGTYTFVFDVTGIPGAPTNADIQAFQGSLPGGGGALAISNGVGVGTAVPEPASLTLLGLGLVGVAFLRRRRQQHA
jgi:PEP-CTERM motif-containing protein